MLWHVSKCCNIDIVLLHATFFENTLTHDNRQVGQELTHYTMRFAKV